MKEFLTNKQEDMEAFRAEIAALKKLEEEGKNSIHLKDCNPNELGEEDEGIYKKLKSNTLTIENFRKYQNETTRSGNESRIRFCAYIANMLSIKALVKYK